ncbi:hypothetical protein [Streptomyces sp. MB09-02B]|uniref:hypothetical protein n=1 Tax=Streptomyces sp. MB09-02B TaxID=3028667 RepID=UPI0029BF7C08|nr:hypothetical protein [Streptomyces sp. MB09-02B]MDX3638073.1 hypothetical protein [Streptomyces sp. MB09-02B]
MTGAGFELRVSKDAFMTRGHSVVRWTPQLSTAGQSPICAVVALEATADSFSNAHEDDEAKADDEPFGRQ